MFQSSYESFHYLVKPIISFTHDTNGTHTKKTIIRFVQ